MNFSTISNQSTLHIRCYVHELQRNLPSRNVIPKLHAHCISCHNIIVIIKTERAEVEDLLAVRVLQPEVEDSHIWKFSVSGQYSAKSAYDAMFIGAIHFQPRERIWKSWAPGKCKLFMWLVAHKRCQTADRLAKRGLSHPEKCPVLSGRGLSHLNFLVSLRARPSLKSCKGLVCKCLLPNWRILHLRNGGTR